MSAPSKLKIYICAVCWKSFSSSSKLKKHKRQQQRFQIPGECRICQLRSNFNSPRSHHCVLDSEDGDSEFATDATTTTDEISVVSDNDSDCGLTIAEVFSLSGTCFSDIFQGARSDVESKVAVAPTGGVYSDQVEDDSKLYDPPCAIVIAPIEDPEYPDIKCENGATKCENKRDNKEDSSLGKHPLHIPSDITESSDSEVHMEASVHVPSDGGNMINRGESNRVLPNTDMTAPLDPDAGGSATSSDVGDVSLARSTFDWHVSPSVASKCELCGTIFRSRSAKISHLLRCHNYTLANTLYK